MYPKAVSACLDWHIRRRKNLHNDWHKGRVFWLQWWSKKYSTC